MRKNVIVTRDRGGGDTNTIVRHEHGFYSETSLSVEQVKEATHGSPLYTLSEIYGLVRNVNWKGTPDNKILAAEMKIKA